MEAETGQISPNRTDLTNPLTDGEDREVDGSVTWRWWSQPLRCTSCNLINCTQHIAFLALHLWYTTKCTESLHMQLQEEYILLHLAAIIEGYRKTSRNLCQEQIAVCGMPILKCNLSEICLSWFNCVILMTSGLMGPSIHWLSVEETLWGLSMQQMPFLGQQDDWI